MIALVASSICAPRASLTSLNTSISPNFTVVGGMLKPSGKVAP